MFERVWPAVFMVVVCAGCGSSSSPADAPSTTFHGEVTDPIGDTFNTSGVVTPPDLVRATADVASGTLTISVRCAPGSFNRDTAAILVQVDTDQSAATGQRNAIGDFGYDYAISWTIAGQQGVVVRITGTDAGFSTTLVGNVSAALAADGVDFVVPLSMLGGDDGRMNFRVLASDRPAIKTTDAMPDENLPAAKIQ